MSATPDPITEKIVQEEHEKQVAARLHFEALFAEWLANRATQLCPPGGEDLPEGEDGKLDARESELARLITTTPSVYPWMINYKIEVLEHYLSRLSDDGGFIDNRELVMFAGIKADLLRFKTDDVDWP
jgi:hypothetical protein